MITINKTEVLVDTDKLESYQHSYETENVFVLPSLFCNSLKELIEKHLQNAQWIHNIHEDKTTSTIIAKEYTLDRQNLIYKILPFYLNHPTVLNIVRAITQSPTIKRFYGRIYKFEGNNNTFDNWHNDISTEKTNRIVGISLNLSPEVYQGGIFSIRNKKTKEIYKHIKHDNWGGAHFFRIHSKLEHKVDQVLGKNPRIAYAGWFIDN